MGLNNDLRRRIIEKGSEIGTSHYPSVFSCVDSIKYLYDNVMKDEDRFLLSKGHGDIALISVLETKGYSPSWTVHLELDEKQGIYSTSGSLGHGIPQGLGRALAKKIQGHPGNVYVLTGDGEMEAGSNYEAMALADRFGLDNLVVMVDWNKHQVNDTVENVGRITGDNLVKRFEAFGWEASIINGHDEGELAKLASPRTGPTAYILDTVKGKGLKCLEDQGGRPAHGYKFNSGNIDAAMEELKD